MKSAHEGRTHAARLQSAHLILHQSDEGTDHHRQAVAQQGGHLVTETLPAPGGGQNHDVVPREQFVDGPALVRPEGTVAEYLLQNFFGRAESLHEWGRKTENGKPPLYRSRPSNR